MKRRRRIHLKGQRPTPPQQTEEHGYVPKLGDAYKGLIERLEVTRVERAGYPVEEALFVDLVVPLSDIQNGVFKGIDDALELVVFYRGCIYGLDKKEHESDLASFANRYRLVYKLTNLIPSGSEL